MSSKNKDHNEGSSATIGCLSSLGRDGTRSAFTPYRPSTVLTNLQRGNIQTQTPSVLHERTLHELAAQGELFLNNLDQKTDIDTRDENGYTPLIWASSYGQLATLRLLLSRNASPFTVGKNGETALLFASANGHVAVVKELLKQKVDVDIQDFNGNTALMHAAHGNHAVCVHELLTAGASFTKKNNASDTAYDIAVNWGSKQAQCVMEKYLSKILMGAKD